MVVCCWVLVGVVGCWWVLSECCVSRCEDVVVVCCGVLLCVVLCCCVLVCVVVCCCVLVCVWVVVCVVLMCVCWCVYWCMWGGVVCVGCVWCGVL